MAGGLRAATPAHQPDPPVPGVLAAARLRHRHHAVLLAVDAVLEELLDGDPAALILVDVAPFSLPDHVRLWLSRAPDVVSRGMHIIASLVETKISNLKVLPARTSMSYIPGCLKVAFANLVFAVIVSDGTEGGEKFHNPCRK